MQITHHVEELQRQLVAAGAAGDAAAQEQAERLVTALEPAARLAILDALSEAAGEITRELAPGSVDVRLRGREVQFAVTRPAPDEAAGTGQVPSAAPSPADDADDGSTSRTTLRLSETLKARAEAAAAAEGISLNAWLVRAVTLALEPRQEPRESRGSSFTGWVR